MIVEKIKQLCRREGITLARLERKIGLGNGTIRRWDKSSPSINKVKKVSDHFNVSFNYLLDIKDDLRLKKALDEIKELHAKIEQLKKSM